MEQLPRHSGDACACCPCPPWVLKRGEQGAARRWVGAAQGRVDAVGQLVCLLQPVTALSGNPPDPLSRTGCRGLSANCGAASPAGVGAGLRVLHRYPRSPENPRRGLNGETGHWGSCTSGAPSPCQAGLQPAVATECQLPAAAPQRVLLGAEVCALVAPGAGKSHGWQDPPGRAGAGQGGLTLTLPLQLG